jgi:DeoR/GlpR family transcriptional regulator of sugar metabolism
VGSSIPTTTRSDQLRTPAVRFRSNVCVYCRVVLAAERRRLVLQAMDSRNAVSVAELADRLSVSPMTIRRDLESLAGQGMLTRVHGGAVATSAAPEAAASARASFRDNAARRLAEKDRIGAAAAQLVRDGETILLDVGTTTLRLARYLRERTLTVITNNLAAYEELQASPRIELLLLGGLVDRHYRSLGGFLAEEALRQVRADRAFLSASAIRASDLAVLDDTAVDLRLKRGMIAAASEVILLADAEKFGQVRPVRVCGPDELDVLITDRAAPETTLSAFEAAGVEVVRV